MYSNQVLLFRYGIHFRRIVHVGNIFYNSHLAPWWRREKKPNSRKENNLRELFTVILQAQNFNFDASLLEKA